MTGRRRAFALLALTALAVAAFGQQPAGEANGHSQLVTPGIEFFVPHWQVDIQGGAAYDVGEASFTELLSPALQASATYQFHPVMGIRLGASGLWARNRHAYPDRKYEWQFVQPAIDLKVDLTSLLLGWRADRRLSAYAFVGGGAAYGYDNSDAVEADSKYYVDFKKLWHAKRWHAMAHGGIGGAVRINTSMALTAEVNANMMPDHFNSKAGAKDDFDWHFNALLGLRIALGRQSGRTEPVYRTQPPVAEYKTQPVTITETVDSIAITENVFFDMSMAEIRPTEQPKLVEIAKYMHTTPTATIRLVGYADRETGTSPTNEKLSRQRVDNVANFLKNRGISSSRISKEAKGDHEQPYSSAEDNRVVTINVSQKVTHTRTMIIR